MTREIEQKQNNDDLRVQRTHKLIQDALLTLTTQKGFSNVTVRDIAREAGINRATFYRHYQDKFDLLDRYAQEVYQLLDQPEDESSKSPGDVISGKTVSGLVRLLEHVRDNADFYRVMLGKNGDPAFAEKIRQYIEKRFRRALPETLKGDNIFTDLYLSYISSGSVGALLWWLEHDTAYSPEELAAISYRLSAANLQAILEE